MNENFKIKERTLWSSAKDIEELHRLYPECFSFGLLDVTQMLGMNHDMKGIVFEIFLHTTPIDDFADQQRLSFRVWVNRHESYGFTIALRIHDDNIIEFLLNWPELYRFRWDKWSLSMKKTNGDEMNFRGQSGITFGDRNEWLRNLGG